MTVEYFGANTAYTPVQNKLYNSYPFGWHAKIQEPDYPRCVLNPYESSESVKQKIHEHTNQYEWHPRIHDGSHEIHKTGGIRNELSYIEPSIYDQLFTVESFSTKPFDYVKSNYLIIIMIIVVIYIIYKNKVV